MNRLITVLLAIAAGILYQCTPPSANGGGGASETVASVAPDGSGIRVAIAADTLFKVEATLCHAEYSAADTGHFRSSAVLTNDDSTWILPQLAASEYSLILINTLNGNGIRFRYDNRPAAVRGLQTGNLAACGGMSGVVTMDSAGGISKPAVGCTVVLLGSTFAAQTDENGGYLLTGIPDGIYTVEAKFASYKLPERNGTPDTAAISGGRTGVYNISIKR
jgi:hypothetical protein